MRIKEAIESLEAFPRFSKSPGLERMKILLEALGDPQKILKYVHVTGTNGKGSTSAMIASILEAAAYKVGLFTSPHVDSYNERFRINGRFVSDEDFVRLFKKVEDAIKLLPQLEICGFEILTAMMFLYFSEQQVDFAVVEVGLGGAFDPTNVIEDSISVITNIGLEHTKYLGRTRRQIAAQKAGIIKPNSIVVVGEQDLKLRQVFSKESERLNARLDFLDLRKLKGLSSTFEGQFFDFSAYRKLFIPLLGAHQLKNAGLALLAIEGLRSRGTVIMETAIREGLKKVSWPLRLELFATHPLLLIDGAHNLQGIGAALSSIKELFWQPKVLIFGCSKNEPYVRLLKKAAILSDTIILVKASIRGVEPEILAQALSPLKRVLIASSASDAWRLAKTHGLSDSLIVCLGSLYLAAELRRLTLSEILTKSS